MTIERIPISGARDTVFAAFGEIMLRLAAPGYGRLLQSPSFEASFGGGEANVLVSLACLGKKTRFVTALPKNDIAAAAIRGLRGFGVDTGHIVLVPGSRMGIYFLETGANQRPSRVIYDRIPSAVSTIEPGAIDWAAAFSGCGWFHITGITPALSRNAADEAVVAVREAKGRGLIVSIDLNYRGNLWKWGTPAPQVMGELAGYADVIIANEEDCQKALGLTAVQSDPGKGIIHEDGYRRLAGEVLERYPEAGVIAITLRESLSASANRWGAMLSDGRETLFSRKYDITHIVDRVGGGDAFAAGLIYGLCHLSGLSEVIEFAAAASCLAHSIPGDWNLCGLDEITALMAGEGTGRIKR
jgi:2-dehydro-3-deoxygluconokinase